LKKAYRQFKIVSENLKVVKVKIVEGELDGSHDQQCFNEKVFIIGETCGIAKKAQISSKNHHPHNEDGLQKDEG
jgi:hypothetical protein